MNKNAITIILAILILGVIAAVAYMFMASNKKAAEPAKITTSQTSGITGLLGNLPPGTIAALL
jgi:flagellar basal body-associated protein FliL